MRVLGIDLETYCDLDLRQVGHYAYAEHHSFEIMLFGYAFDDEPVEVIDLMNNETIPKEVINALLNPKILKTALNAPFERIAITNHWLKHGFFNSTISGLPYGNMPKAYNLLADPTQWECTQVHLRTLGLPPSLEKAAIYLKLDEQKDKKGSSLIRYFTKPCKPTKRNGYRTRNLPEHAPEKWEDFKKYCGQDVVVERDIRKKLEVFPVMQKEKDLWVIDQRINDRGILIDLPMVKNIVKEDIRYQEDLKQRAEELAGISNVNSNKQVKEYLHEEIGRDVDASLNKAAKKRLIKKDLPADVEEVMQIVNQLSMSSVSKYHKMLEMVCPDGRIRGTFLFHGAGTARWAGKGIQPQNLTKHKMPTENLDGAREVATTSDYELIEMLYGNFAGFASELVRTALIPGEGKRFLVADFSAIEARVIAWIADEKWRQEVFATHGKIYEASASEMFSVDIDTIVKDHENYSYRAKGKVAELALGYQGSVGALKAMGALKMGLNEEELKPLVNAWRKANPNIVQLWYDMENLAKKVTIMYFTSKGKSVKMKLHHNIYMSYQKGIFFIHLPSGRRMAYPRMRLIDHPKWEGQKALAYDDGGRKIDTYGGKLTENLIQAIARDCLAESLINTEAKGYKNHIHVHDEQVMEINRALDPEKELKKVYAIMSAPIDWAPGLLLGADGFTSDYYMKD